MPIQKPDSDGRDAPKAGAGKPAKKAAPLVVHSYSGFKGEERPRAFELDGRRLTVLSVKKTWQEEAEHGRRRKTIFRVYAHDGRSYDLARDANTGEWTLEPFARDRA